MIATIPLDTPPITSKEIREKIATMFDRPDRANDAFQEILFGWIARGNGIHWSAFSRCKDLEALAETYGTLVSSHVVRRYLTGERHAPRLDTLAGIVSTILWDVERHERGASFL